MGRFIDLSERLFLLLLSAGFLIRFVGYIPTHPWTLALIASEMLAVALILIRKPGEVSLSPRAIALAFIGTGAPLLSSPGAGPSSVTLPAILMVGGLLFSVSAKVALNRRFGAIPANRGIQAIGPYAFVRHPMYLGYAMTQVGFLISAPSLWNAGVYLVGFVFQLLRIHEEEKLLSSDPVYRSYSGRVKYRLAPGLY